MENSKLTGRVYGLFLLSGFICGVKGTFSRGLTDLDFQSSESVFPQLLALKDQMNLAIRLDMLASAITLAAGLYIYHKIATIHKSLSISFIAVISINFVVALVSNLIHYALLELANNPTPNVSNEIGFILFQSYYWLHFLIIFMYSVSGFILYLIFVKGKLTYKWIAYWGMAASAIVMYGSMAQFLDFSVPFVLFMQNGVFVLTFIIYLLAVGFRDDVQNTISQ